MQKTFTSLRLTAEFLMTVTIGLLASYIFTICIAGGVYDLAIKNTRWIGTCPKDLVLTISNGKFIALWQEFNWLDIWLFAVIGANLVRVVHSFFMLQRDQNYILLFYSATSKLRNCLSATQVFIQFVIVVVSLFAVPQFGKQWSDAVGWIVIGILIFWDLPAYMVLRKTSQATLTELRKTFQRWSWMDGIVITVCAITYLIIGVWRDHGGTTIMQIENTLVREFISALGLTIILLTDYIFLNPTFYWGNYHSALANRTAPVATS